MSVIRVVRGTGTGPTALASYDAALGAAGIGNYNLVTVSSVLPAETPVEVVETAPDLGPAGDRLTVVESRQTSADPGRVTAGLGWVHRRDDGPGIVYEAAGADPTDVETRIREGLRAGVELREWTATEPSVLLETTSVAEEGFTTAVVCAVFGAGDPVV